MVIANPALGDIRPITKKAFYVAMSCDGATDFDSLAFLPEHHDVLTALIHEGIAEPCAEGDGIAPHQHYRKAANPYLTSIQWCVTGNCNLHCRHCYMESPAGRYGELSFDEMTRLVGQFERANVLQVSLTGGEPFLRKDINEIIDLLAERSICLTRIYSNGLLITDEHLAEIKKNGFTPSFQISFDGVGTHDYMRGCRGIEAGVLAAIRRIVASGFPVVVSTSLDRMTARQLMPTYELMIDLGVRGWRIASPQASGNWKGSSTALSMDEEAQALAPLLGRWLTDGKPFFLQLAGFFRSNQVRENGLAPGATNLHALRHTPESYDCALCREQPNLLPDGTLVPCPGYVDTPLQALMPNLLSQELSEAWSSSFLREIADIKKKELLAKNPECHTCEFFEECGLGCRASAYGETGDLTAKDPLSCKLWKTGYKKKFEELALPPGGCSPSMSPAAHA